jgi:hypothetical protein
MEMGVIAAFFARVLREYAGESMEKLGIMPPGALPPAGDQGTIV